MIKYLTMTIEKQKNIALIAHDGKKQDMLKWCMDNKEILQQPESKLTDSIKGLLCRGESCRRKGL